MTTAVLGLHPLPTPPLTRSRKSDFKGRCRSPRPLPVSCGYSCFEVREVSYRPPGTQLSLSKRTSFSLPEKSYLKGRSRWLFPVSCDYSCFEVREVTYRPPGTQLSLLNQVSFSLPEKSFGLIYGQSGSGKTTLLQLLAGLNAPTSGSICIQRYGDDGIPLLAPQSLFPERVGIVFQFPERYFVADTVLDEIVFGWPRRKSSLQFREQLALNVQRAMNWVGLNGIPLDRDPHSLSGGYKRRLALAIQLVQVPDLLILDEPFAGLDWKARADVVNLLKHIKRELTVLVVSHDLKELAALVDHSWRMKMGGYLDKELLQI